MVKEWLDMSQGEEEEELELMDEEARLGDKKKKLLLSKREDRELYRESEDDDDEGEEEEGGGMVLPSSPSEGIVVPGDDGMGSSPPPPSVPNILDLSLPGLGLPTTHTPTTPFPPPITTTITPADRRNLTRLTQLFFTVASKQYGYIVQVKGAERVAKWLVGRKLGEPSEATRSERACQAICDKVRMKYPGQVALDPHTLQTCLEDLESLFGLTEEGDPVTHSLDPHLDRSFESLELVGSATPQVLDITKYFHVVDGFKLPRLVYDKVMKSFVSHPHPSKILNSFNNGNHRAEVYLERYHLLKLKILRNDLFAPPSIFNPKPSHLVLTPIKSLLGRVEGQFCLFGMLIQQNDGSLAIQDEDSSVKLQFLDTCRYGKALFTEYSFVLVEGETTEDEIFQVHSITLTPHEDRETTLDAYGHVRWLGPEVAPIPQALLKTLSEEFSDISVVVLSDVHLDQPNVLLGLRRLFENLEEEGVPLAIVMMGSFTTRPVTTEEAIREYQDNFTGLGNLIAEFETIASWTRFIMVPGPHDPVLLTALPIPALPTMYHQGLTDRIPNVIFTSNPTRIQIGDKEIVLMRHNLINQTLRNLLLPLPDKVATNPISIQKHFVRTIVDSGHLAPLPHNVQPLLLSYDHALRLPLSPHLLVLADITPPFATPYRQTHYVNPGQCLTTLPTPTLKYFQYRPFTATLEQRTIELL